MARLRAPDGCPWDREQTFSTIKRFTLEETYEVLEAIDSQDYPALCEELGDLLLQPVFHAQMASEQGLFDIADSLRSINEKLIRRHPHIFGSVEANTPDQVLKNWDAIKAEEKQAKGVTAKGLLDGITRAQPALMEATEISKKAAKAGFEWDNLEQVAAKLDEEKAEFLAAVAAGDAHDIEDELGDLLFTVVNLARWAKVDPEQALRRTNAKFRRRFAHVEARVAEKGGEVPGTPIAELESYWQEAKRS
jgi:MazG family protein